MLTPELQQQIMARDDWVFHAERNLLACITKGAFASAAEIIARFQSLDAQSRMQILAMFMRAQDG